jgi:hypothetical protein
VPSSSITVQEDINKNANDGVIHRLVEPLNRRFPFTIDIKFKDDPNKIFHARYLEAQGIIISIERGFDFIKGDGSFRRNFVKLDNGAYTHLKECRDLKDSIF